MTPPKEIEPITSFEELLEEKGRERCIDDPTNQWSVIELSRKLNELIDGYNQLIKQHEKKD